MNLKLYYNKKATPNNRSLVCNYDLIDNATIRVEVNRVKKVLHEDFINNIRGVRYMIERPNGKK